MITIEEVKEEYSRVSTLLKKEALTGDDWNHNCKEGFTVFQIKKQLGLSWNAIKKIIGAKEATTLRRRDVAKKSFKILCNRDGSMISNLNCVPGCNDACIPCENKQWNNVKAGGYPVTPEEDRDFASSFGNSGALAAAEGIYSN